MLSSEITFNLQRKVWKHDTVIAICTQEAQCVVGTLTQIISELNVATSPSSWKICPEIYSV